MDMVIIIIIIITTVSEKEGHQLLNVEYMAVV